MTGAALALVGGTMTGGAPIELRAEDRLQCLAAPMRRLPNAMIAIAAASSAVHVALMAAAIVAARVPLVIAPQKEISVEVIQEAPKLAPKPPEAKPAPAAKAPEPSPQKQAHSDTRLPQAATPTPTDPDAGRLRALQQELENLRAEQAALSAKQTQMASGKALALPSIGAGDGDAVGYQQLVFSQLAKAKGDTEYRGQAGTTGVRFEIDEAGKLVRAAVVRSSGSAALDGQALDIVHRAAPFPPPPTADDRIIFANVNFVPPKTPGPRR